MFIDNRKKRFNRDGLKNYEHKIRKKEQLASCLIYARALLEYVIFYFVAAFC